jgi:hypothetical protein
MQDTLGTARAIHGAATFSGTASRDESGTSAVAPIEASFVRPETAAIPQGKQEVTMVRSYLPSLLGRDDDPFGSLFREVQKTFDDFSRRSPRWKLFVPL